MEHAERPAVEQVGLEVEQRDPDPHGRQHLDERQAPVREQQLHALEEHHERSDQEGEGSQVAAGAAEVEDGLFDRGVVTGSIAATRSPMRPISAWVRDACPGAPALGEGVRLLPHSRRTVVAVPRAPCLGLRTSGTVSLSGRRLVGARALSLSNRTDVLR